MKTTIKVIDNRIYFGKDSYALEKKFVKKLDRMIKGVTQEKPKEDALLINEGKEGKGKSNTAFIEACYFKAKTGRDIHVFFKLEDMINFAKSTEKKIIWWDEPSLDSLSKDQLNNLNKNLERLMMTVRKKRHLFIINYTKFWKFLEYIIVDRAIGMVHMKEKKIGRFFYIRKKRLEFLWNQYRTKKRRDYLKASSFGGNFPDLMESYFEFAQATIHGIKNATFEDYEKQKDVSILSIGDKEKSKAQIQDEKRIKIWQERIVKIIEYAKRKGLSQRELCAAGNFPRVDFYEIRAKLLMNRPDVTTGTG